MTVTDWFKWYTLNIAMIDLVIIVHWSKTKYAGIQNPQEFSFTVDNEAGMSSMTKVCINMLGL